MGHRITSVLSALNIARSTYYQWKNWQPSQQETRRTALKTAIKAVYNTNRGIYGYRRIAAFLRFILEGLQWFAISDRLHLSVRRLQEIMQNALNSFGLAFLETLDSILRICENY